MVTQHSFMTSIFDVHTEIDYVASEEILKIIPSEIALEGAVF